MPILTFDTLKFANRLKTAGVPPAQAEAEAEALSEVLETNLGELATKEDLQHAINESTSALRQEMAGSASALSQEMKELGSALRQEMVETASALRQDIADWHHEMDTKFEKSVSALRQEISDVKFELLKWLIGLAIVQAGLLIGLLKFFPVGAR